MKKLLNISFIYLLAGAAAGVFFREFTKFNGFDGVTTLGLVHPHLLALGFIVFLIATLFCMQKDFTGDKLFLPFMIIYNAGLIVTAIMFFVRGITQVLATTLPIPDAAISGIAGLGHICIGVGLVLLVLMFKKVVATKAAVKNA
ncbi:MAG: DUF2871 domain-containing protein [Raoultibacter sp.]